MNLKEITPRDLGNDMKMIGDDWTLITAEKKDGSVNTMTASWGFMGVLWNKPVCAVFIRPQRHTLGFVEEAERLSLTFFPKSTAPPSVCAAPRAAATWIRLPRPTSPFATPKTACLTSKRPKPSSCAASCTRTPSSPNAS